MRAAHAPHRADELDGSRERFIRIPLSTIVKVLLVLVALWSIYKLATVIALVLVAVVLAISLEPIVVWLERHGLARWVASTVVVFTLAGVLITFDTVWRETPARSATVAIVTFSTLLSSL